jgi:hypothetical protein
MTLIPASHDMAAAAAMLISADYLTTRREVLDFMIAPHKWQAEVTLWVAAGSPDQDSPGWALFAARLATVENRQLPR